jgi:hypothetical protein
VTVLVATLTCVLALCGAGFSAALAETSALRAAQIAADAAALAAVAESGPYGKGRVREVAQQYAEANGARLMTCDCTPGTSGVQLTVKVDDVVAAARAVLDVALLEPARTTFDRRRLHPLLARAVERLIEASSGRVWVVSGYRSEAEQRILWEEALRRYGSPDRADDWVARPGGSMHERGLAVDFGGDIDAAVGLVRELNLPLHRPLRNEPWHFELMGSRH